MSINTADEVDLRVQPRPDLGGVEIEFEPSESVIIPPSAALLLARRLIDAVLEVRAWQAPSRPTTNPGEGSNH
jgi:hypothetical protein